MPRPNEPSSELHQPGLGFLARAFWMMLGNIILVFAIIAITQRKSGKWGTADIVFWVTVALLAMARYLDIRLWNGLTAAGAPATNADLRKYWILLGIVSAVLWGLAHLLNRP